MELALNAVSGHKVISGAGTGNPKDTCKQEGTGRLERIGIGVPESRVGLDCGDLQMETLFLQYLHHHLWGVF